MKKLFTLILALAFGFGLKAQCPYTQAIDFTATDVHGTEIHLFDILDSGQAVLIDFFFTSCGPCQQATPKIAESYYAMGCNMHDVYYIEISDRDNNTACQNWVTNYGIEYPTIGSNGGGGTITNQYGINAWPTVILIMPNRQIVIQDLWPINSAQTVISQLEAHGLQQHDCTAPGPTYDPQVALSIDEVTENSITATFTPNADCASYYYLCATEAEIMGWIMSGASFDEIIQEYGGVETAAMTNTFDGLTPETEYMVLALPVDPDGNYGDVVRESVTTPQAIVYDETLTFSLDTIELPYDLGAEITVYNNTAEDAVIHGIQETNEVGLCLITFLINGEEYLCPDNLEISLPKGESLTMFMRCDMVGKDEPEYIEDLVTVSSNLPDASFSVMVEHAWSVDENEASVTLYPNPANDFVTLSGENLGTVRVFNVMGQRVEEFEANGSELRINTTGYDNGVYFVKTDETTLRFVVRH